MVGHIEGVDRHQPTFLPDCLDDWVAADSMVRVIDAFVARLDLDALGFLRARPAATGRPPYHPGDLLGLYVYGYLNRLRSSRRLEREACRNLELVWLLRRLTPDFKTIADFRRDNLAALTAACRAFVLFCRETGIVQGQLVAIDGSHVAATASRRQAFGRDILSKVVERIDAAIAAQEGRGPAASPRSASSADRGRSHRSSADVDRRRARGLPHATQPAGAAATWL